ncbi:MAG: hypothetical protein HRT60_09965 [Dinoroseobacter sp.]|nr:hypothetical protein [Dinoroseobacter sp.]NQZ73384.1 hypothetical protein [Dinoroseobacter sp.]
MTQTIAFHDDKNERAPLREDHNKNRAMHSLRERAAQEHRTARRLNDAITALLLLVAFPFGMALLALSICFGRSLPRALAAMVFMSAVNLTALANSLFFEGEMDGLLSNNSGLLALIVKVAQAAG